MARQSKVARARDLDGAGPRPGIGVVLWLHADDAQGLHDSLAAAGVPILVAPFDGPFGSPRRTADDRAAP